MDRIDNQNYSDAGAGAKAQIEALSSALDDLGAPRSGSENAPRDLLGYPKSASAADGQHDRDDSAEAPEAFAEGAVSGEGEDEDPAVTIAPLTATVSAASPGVATTLTALLDRGNESGSVLPPPKMDDEFRLALCEIKRWKGHERKSVSLDKGAARALYHRAVDPEAIEPLGVLLVDNSWVVGDGLVRLEALIEQHGHESTISVRVVKLEGDEAATVAKRFRETFCTTGNTEFEKARLVAAFCGSANLHYKVVAAQIGWTPSKVSKYLTAAGLEALYPRFFQLLREPIDPPMDYAYYAGKAVRAAEKAGTLAPLLATLEKLLKNKTRFEGCEALAKLGIQRTAKPRAKAEIDDLMAAPTGAQIEAIESDAIFDEQDNPVGAVEILADHVPRLKLPLGIADMPLEQKAYLKGRYIEEIQRYFG